MNKSNADVGMPEETPVEFIEQQVLLLGGSPALAKACGDSFNYALKLRTGEVIMFQGAELVGDKWVHLSGVDTSEPDEGSKLPFPARRGIDVRLSEIMWVMDGPYEH
jgi:hypothetical protein